MTRTVNSAHKARIFVIPRLRNAYAEIHVSDRPTTSIETVLHGADPPVLIHQLNEVGADGDEGDVYNFPFIFHGCGLPWHEANSYLLNNISNTHKNRRPTDEARRKAGKLLEYLLFCEREGIDWTDFSGKRPSLRPTYRFYKYLVDRGGRVGAVINQYTQVVYDFYVFVSKNFHDIDMARVESVKQLKFLIDTPRGARYIEIAKRSQTVRTPKATPVRSGFVRDEGEDLRPLANNQLAELLTIIDSPDWSANERLILKVGLMTGARKQSVLTLRVRHVRQLAEAKARPDGTYMIAAGPGTGIDTKFDKHQKLYFPKQLVDDLRIFVDSPLSRRRQARFLEEKARSSSDDIPPDPDDVYVFLSDQGNCYYLAKDDSRYKAVKSPPTGQVADTIIRKLRRFTSENFPQGFKYHWLRATFAFQLYQRLKPALLEDRLMPGEEISYIQHRLHHSDRSITEHYLKLFTMESEKLESQELYEDWLFSFAGYSDLILEGAGGS